MTRPVRMTHRLEPAAGDAAAAIAAARDRFDFAARELHLLMCLAELRGASRETVTAAARMTPEAAAAVVKRHGCGYRERPGT